MITSIEIENFRCFKKTKIGKFKAVNLIGGLNNSGKTALLEAIHLISSPSVDTVMFLQRMIRDEELDFIKEKPENAWNSLFFEENKQQEVSIKGENNDCICKIVLKSDEEINDFIEFVNEEDSDDEDMIKFSNVLSERDNKKSALHVDVFKSEKKEFSSVLVASKIGVIARGTATSKFRKSRFIPASAKLPNHKLAEEFDKARFDNNESIVLEAIKIIDNSIVSVETFNIGKANIYLKKGDTRLPLSLFGDAVNKVVNIVLQMVNNPNNIIIIDEIENGIHHSAQENLWEMLFGIAIKYEIQIFATTHSYEMARAFVKAVENKKFDSASYFEMARHHKTGNIIGLPIPIDVLEYDIKSNSPFRGE